MAGSEIKLSWPDLLVDLTGQDWQSWLSDWSRVVQGKVAPAFLNKFGSWFLRRPSGQVELLDVFTGSVGSIASTNEEFVARVNDPAWQETYLLSELVYELHLVGKIPGPTECYALAPHPALGGPNPMIGEKVDLKYVMVMGLRVYQSLCVQSVWPDLRPR